jgi:DNA replication protein DnaC
MSEPFCPICGDSGWVLVDRPAPIYGPTATVTKAVGCLCVEGLKRTAPVVSQGKRAASLVDVWSPVQIAAAFPDGTAGATEQAARARLAATGLPLVCRSWTVASYREQVVAGDKEQARYAHWADNWIGTAADDRGDVVLYGSKGTGKTGLAVAMARGAFDAGATVRFTTARALMLEFRDSMRDSGDGERSVDAAYLEPQVLVLDEFGGASLTDYLRDTLTALVDSRQKAKRSTLITLNVEDNLSAPDVQAQMREILGVRLADRLVDTALWWALVGKSKRKPRRTRVQPFGGADARR